MYYRSNIIGFILFLVIYSSEKEVPVSPPTRPVPITKIFISSEPDTLTICRVMNSELKTNKISGVRFDDSGNAWITTFGNGLYRFKLEKYLRDQGYNSNLGSTYLN